MEVASAPTKFSARVRLRAFEKECVRLRPMGEAYVRRRFSGQLGDADAEDAVSEVLLRLHRQIESGRAPGNLQAAFFTGVRNASIDILRSRASRPTVGLEAVADAVADSVSPFERAESAEDAVRLQEALGRMRGNYREAVVLRFGLGLTVPEIAEEMGISLPAAKKLVLRATAQARKRLEAIDGHEFCPEMQDVARRAVYDREAVGVLDSEEARVLHAHFRHCGACRSFLARLHEDLHELGGSVVVASGLGWHFGVLERVRGVVDGVGHHVGAVHERMRWVGYRISGAFSSGDGGAASGAFASGQKVAAVCTAGVAGAASCLASGVVGPGIGLGVSHRSQPVPKPPPAKVKATTRRVEDAAPSHGLVVVPSPVVSEAPEADEAAPSSGFVKPRRRGSERGGAQKAKVRKAGGSPASRAEETEAEFGFEAGAGSGEAATPVESGSAPESTQTVQSETTTQAPVTSSGSSAPSSSSSSSGGGGSSGGSDFGGFEK